MTDSCMQGPVVKELITKDKKLQAEINKNQAQLNQNLCYNLIAHLPERFMVKAKSQYYEYRNKVELHEKMTDSQNSSDSETDFNVIKSQTPKAVPIIKEDLWGQNEQLIH